MMFASGQGDSAEAVIGGQDLVMALGGVRQGSDAPMAAIGIGDQQDGRRFEMCFDGQIVGGSVEDADGPFFEGGLGGGVRGGLAEDHFARGEVGAFEGGGGGVLGG